MPSPAPDNPLLFITLFVTIVFVGPKLALLVSSLTPEPWLLSTVLLDIKFLLAIAIPEPSARTLIPTPVLASPAPEPDVSLQILPITVQSCAPYKLIPYPP